MLATVVIPISPEHWQLGYYHEAKASVEAQTIPTEIILIRDEAKKGAAWARNQGTSQVKTPFVIWLDADDTLHPEFVEKTVVAYQLGSFVYTDWQLHGINRIVPYPLDPFGIGQQHVITTLMPVAAWKAAGGFDESLDSLEDEDFYRRIACYGWRGVKADGVLVDYRRNKGFSKVNLEAVDPDIVKLRIAEKSALFKKRYGKFEAMYMYVSNQQKPKLEVVGERRDNDVLCEANYSPMTQAGAVTRRKYPRAGLGQPIWVDHDDALARPDLWRIIAQNPDMIAPDVEKVRELYEQAKAENEAKERAQAPIIPDEPIAIPEGVSGFDAMSLDALRQEFAKRDLKEADLTNGVTIHWKLLRKLMIDYLKGLPHEAPA